MVGDEDHALTNKRLERELTSGMQLRLGSIEVEFRAFADGVQEDAVKRPTIGVLGRLRRMVAKLLAGRGSVGE